MQKSNSNRATKKRKREGKNESDRATKKEVPNVLWLHVPEEHLRAHPEFQPLPPPQTITRIKSWADLKLFRQDSWQWNTMHEGRLTTSKAAAVMGILEQGPAYRLHIPKSLWSSDKALNAFHHLCGATAFRTLREAGQVLIDQPEDQISNAEYLRSLKDLRKRVWRPWASTKGFDWKLCSDSCVWAAEYVNVVQKKPLQDFGTHVRMIWGNVHEATGVLVALNYFHSSKWKVSECGMFPGEALLERLSEKTTFIGKRHMFKLKKLHDLGCPIGATPDGIITHPDGTVEALEVKNHCPFWYKWNEKKTVISDRSPTENVPSWTVPQLQLEMFCIGIHCRSVVLVRLTATKGAVIIRLRRDDDFISFMLSRFIKFYSTFVRRNRRPTKNFLSQDDPIVSAVLKQKGELVAKVPHEMIQRSRPNSLPLFSYV